MRINLKLQQKVDSFIENNSLGNNILSFKCYKKNSKSIDLTFFLFVCYYCCFMKQNRARFPFSFFNQ